MLIRCEPWTCAVDGLNMGLNYYASSPVLIPTAQTSSHPHLQLGNQSHEGGAILEPAFSLQAAPAKRLPKYPTPPSLNYQARPSTGVAGRKRSRDDTDMDNIRDVYQDELEASSRVPAMEASKPEPILGPGMTLIYPDQPSMSGISAESQSGTWLEETIEDVPERPQLTSRKSLRLAEEDLSNEGVTNHYVDEHDDPIVRKLGIGWKRLSSSQQSAAAGSETYIRKQFDMYNPRMLLHHEGLAIYVVSSEPFSAPGYWQQFWLFREDLKSCRFLCRDEEELFARLSNKRQDERGIWIPDIVCEGPERFARDVSEPESLPENSPTNSIFGAAMDSIPVATDVEMMG